MLRIKIFCNFERYIVMADFEIIKCHGSGNDFVMVDTTREKSFAGVDRSAFARAVSDRVSGIGSDGVLYVVRHDDGHYAMDMYNPDGTQAEMCGNGMRCVARLADERGYIVDGILRSGGRDYPVERAESIAEGIATYAVDIPIAVSSPDFAFFGSSERWLGKVIEANRMSNAEPHADIINIPSGFFACLRNENIYLGHLRYFVFAFWKFARFLLKSKACKRQKIKSASWLCHKTM